MDSIFWSGHLQLGLSEIHNVDSNYLPANVQGVSSPTFMLKDGKVRIYLNDPYIIILALFCFLPYLIIVVVSQVDINLFYKFNSIYHLFHSLSGHLMLNFYI